MSNGAQEEKLSHVVSLTRELLDLAVLNSGGNMSIAVTSLSQALGCVMAYRFRPEDFERALDILGGSALEAANAMAERRAKTQGENDLNPN